MILEHRGSLGAWAGDAFLQSFWNRRTCPRPVIQGYSAQLVARQGSRGTQATRVSGKASRSQQQSEHISRVLLGHNSDWISEALREELQKWSFSVHRRQELTEILIAEVLGRGGSLELPEDTIPTSPVDAPSPRLTEQSSLVFASGATLPGGASTSYSSAEVGFSAHPLVALRLLVSLCFWIESIVTRGFGGC
jgi:hypothetical protein